MKNCYTFLQLFKISILRLFFINWKPFNWSIALKDLPFDFKYNEIKDKLYNGKPLLCLNEKNKHQYFIKGHLTNQHFLLQEKHSLNKLVST